MLFINIKTKLVQRLPSNNNILLSKKIIDIIIFFII